MEATINSNDTELADSDTAIKLVDTFSSAATDLDAAQSVIAEVKGELDGPHAERLHVAVCALQGVIEDLEDGQDTAEGLLDALR